VTMSS